MTSQGPNGGAGKQGNCLEVQMRNTVNQSVNQTSSSRNESMMIPRCPDLHRILTFHSKRLLNKTLFGKPISLILFISSIFGHQRSHNVSRQVNMDDTASLIPNSQVTTTTISHVSPTTTTVSQRSPLSDPEFYQLI
jgi:hypothetical protein